MEALHLPYIRCILCVREGMVHSNEWRLYIFLTLDMYLCVREGMVHGNEWRLYTFLTLDVHCVYVC